MLVCTSSLVQLWVRCCCFCCCIRRARCWLGGELSAAAQFDVHLQISFEQHLVSLVAHVVLVALDVHPPALLGVILVCRVLVVVRPAALSALLGGFPAAVLNEVRVQDPDGLMCMILEWMFRYSLYKMEHILVQVCYNCVHMCAIFKNCFNICVDILHIYTQMSTYSLVVEQLCAHFMKHIKYSLVSSVIETDVYIWLDC